MPTGVYTRTEYHRRINSEGQNKRYEDPKVREQLSKAQKKRFANETLEVRIKHRENIKKALNRPEIKLKQIENQREIKNSPEYKRKVSESAKISQNRPEVRALKSKAMKGKMVGDKHYRWNPDRDAIAKGEATRQQFTRYLKMPFRNKITKQMMIECLHYTSEQFLQHIEDSFSDGMNWQNRGRNKGQWLIHHRIPVSWFSEFDILAPYVVNALNNLKPVCVENHYALEMDLRKFTKDQRRFWVELFVFYINSKKSACSSMIEHR